LFASSADSDESGHLFQSMSDTIPILSDSCRSEVTLFVTYKRVSDRSQDFVTSLSCSFQKENFVCDQKENFLEDWAMEQDDGF
jgi:hypothetical protein